MMNTTKPKKKTKSKSKKPILSAEDKALLKRQSKLHKDLMSMFKPMGFEYLQVSGFHKTYGGIKSELDSAFIFENLLIICEETVSSDKDHLRKKYDYFEKIKENRDEFLNDFKVKYKEKFDKFDNYTNNEYKIFFIYVTESRQDEELKQVYSEFKYIDSKSLKYFIKIFNCLKYTARNEFYKFLNIDLTDIGSAATRTVKSIESAVIIPERSSGFPEGVQLFSFLMTAEDLMDCAYVFRKDSWNSGSNYYYQRLIETAKVENIRKYLAEHQRTFIDNIIVSIPDDVTFGKKNEKNQWVDFPDINKSVNIENVKINIPYKINSIGIIDGQHRIYGHYRGNDSMEPMIDRLRKKRHLLVTGLYYDKDKFPEIEKRKFESELFLQINSKQKKADTQLLQFITNLKTPNSSVGLAISVINYLNNTEPFLDLFHLSPLDNAGIKTPTIITYALKDLLEISDSKETLYKYWDSPNKKDLTDSKFTQEALDEYVIFASKAIIQYFKAVKSNNKEFWTIAKKDESKLLSVTSIVAFLIAFKKSLEKYQEIKNGEFFNKKLKTLNIDFKRGNFQYVSSQWPKFVEVIEKSWT